MVDACPCILGLLREASAALETGQMLSTPNFSLLEAMSAVELGNDKMDAAVAGGSTKPAAELIQEGLAPVALAPAQQLGVMERLLVMEVGGGAGIM